MNDNELKTVIKYLESKENKLQHNISAVIGFILGCGLTSLVFILI